MKTRSKKIEIIKINRPVSLMEAGLFHVGGWIDVYKADESELEFARFIFYLKIRYKKLGEQEVC